MIILDHVTIEPAHEPTSWGSISPSMIYLSLMEEHHRHDKDIYMNYADIGGQLTNTRVAYAILTRLPA